MSEASPDVAVSAPARSRDSPLTLEETLIAAVAQPAELPAGEGVVALATTVRERKSVRFHYRSGLGEEGERKLDPSAVVHREGYWYAVGQDHLRGEAWLFRLDRVLEAELLGETFVLPPGFDAPRQVLYALAAMPQDRWSVEVLLETALEEAPPAGAADGGDARRGGGRRAHALLHLGSGLHGARVSGTRFPVRSAPAARAPLVARASRGGDRHPRGACQGMGTTVPTLKDYYWSVCRRWISWCTARRVG